MALQVVNGALLKCSFGLAPSTFVCLPIHMTQGEKQPAANIMDFVPMENIMPFGMCNTPSNPEVAAATAAAMGALTPMPCVPVIPAPWVPGAPKTLIQNFPALNMECQCMCTWGGVITITEAGEFTIDVN